MIPSNLQIKNRLNRAVAMVIKLPVNALCKSMADD